MKGKKGPALEELGRSAPTTLDDEPMKNKTRKPFIPRDKPKSWIIAILSGLGGLFIAGPLIILGYFLESEIIRYLGMVLFVGFWLDFALMGLLFMVGSLQGRYKNMSEKDWLDQVW